VDNLANTTNCCAAAVDTGWREDDFRRVKDDASRHQVGLRGNNDEELVRMLYETSIRARRTALQRRHGIVAGENHAGRREAFYKSQYSQAQLIIGIGWLLAGVSGVHEEGLRGTAGDGDPQPRISAAAIEKSRAVMSIRIRGAWRTRSAIPST